MLNNARAVTVSAGEVRANGTPVPLSGFAAEAARLKDGGAKSVVVFVRPSATAQDIVSVLEGLKRAEFPTVSVRTGSCASATRWGTTRSRTSALRCSRRDGFQGRSK